MVVKRSPGDIGLVDDLVDTGDVITLVVEQPRRRVQYPIFNSRFLHKAKDSITLRIDRSVCLIRFDFFRTFESIVHQKKGGIHAIYR